MIGTQNLVKTLYMQPEEVKRLVRELTDTVKRLDRELTATRRLLETSIA
jgi:hypothetical protein